MRRKRIGRDGERSVGIDVSELNREVNVYMNSNRGCQCFFLILKRSHMFESMF